MLVKLLRHGHTYLFRVNNKDTRTTTIQTLLYLMSCMLTLNMHLRNQGQFQPVKLTHCTKMKFFIKDFFCKCDHIRRKLQIWSHLLKKSLMENFILCAVSRQLDLLGGKINHLREIFSPIDILCVDETKIDSGYPDAQFSN